MCCCKPDNETEDLNTCVILKNHGITMRKCSAMMSPRRKLGMNLTGYVV